MIRLHIERLVLDGLDLNRAEAERVKGALEAELTHLLSKGQLSPNLLAGGHFSSLDMSSLAGVRHAPEGLGQEIARTVYGRIGGAE